MTARPLAVLAFDHRERAFSSVRPDGMTHDQIRQSKRLIFDAFRLAHEQGLGDTAPGILIDEQFGADIAEDAAAAGTLAAMPVERAFQKVFTFEYGEDFREHLLRFQPQCAKVLIHHRTSNPPQEKALQLARLRELSEFLAERSMDLMCELIIGMGEPSADDVPSVDVDELCASITEIQQAGVQVTIWKVEGIATSEDAERVAALAAAGERPATCVVMGGGAPTEVVERWLDVAARTSGFTGFAIGRSFWGAAVRRWLDGTLSREDAIAEIAALYRSCTLRYSGVDA